jgi:hypothetical protein
MTVRLISITLLLCVALVPQRLRADELGSAIYVRTDTDHTTVVSPRVRAAAEVAQDTTVDVAYGADVWTSASIDIRTAASKVVTEQRDELDVSLTHKFTDVTLGGGYRFSIENDYESHSGSGSLSYDFADNAATLAFNAFVSSDAVGRSGDTKFDRALRSLGSGVGFTQVLDTRTIVQATYDLGYFNGYQASPYRFVPIGDGPCTSALVKEQSTAAALASICVPERTPDIRLRHALGARIRRALGETTSAGLSYRLYLDDWGVSSHTVQAQVAWLPAEASLLTFRYRFYVQSGASFYKRSYSLTDPGLRYLTIDRELSKLGIHRLGLDYEYDAKLGDDVVLKGVLSSGINLYRYDNFRGLDHVTALELSAAAVLVL